MRSELEKLQGTWTVTSLEVEGNRLSKASFEGSTITIKDEHFETAAMGAVYKGTFSVDARALPGSIDMHFSDGPEKGNTSLGIYELDGDTWILCLTIAGHTRPAAFATSPGSGHALERLTRDSDKRRGSARTVRQGKSHHQTTPGPDFSNVRFDPVPELEGEWEMVSGIRDGHEMDQSMIKTARRISSGCETSVSFGGQLFLKAKYTVNKARHPHEIDYYHTAGGSEGKVQRGIFKVEAGVMTVVFSPFGEDRPTDFICRKGDGRTLTEWKKK